MKYSEKLIDLVRRLFEGKLSTSEREQLHFLQQEEGADEVIKSELYIKWKENPTEGRVKHTGESFQSVREKLGISEGKLRQDRLILEGLDYERSRSGGRSFTKIFKYAAAVVVLLCTGWILGLVTNRLAETGPEVGYNEIVVPNGSKSLLTLPDSSVVWLNAGSTLRYPGHFNKGSREVYLEGEAFFDITENQTVPFFVRTTDIAIKVLGTRFNVKSYPEEDIIETTLVSGKIEILEEMDNRSGTALRLNPDQKALYSKKARAIRLEDKAKEVRTRPSAIRPTNVLKLPDIAKQDEEHIEIKWKDNLLIFRDEPLGSLVRKLERWYGVEIDLADEELSLLMFTGTIANETVEQAMEAFKLASPINYTIDKNKIEIWKKK